MPRFSSSATTAPDTVIGIDLLRFACTLPVLIWHYQHFFYVAGHPVAGFASHLQPGYPWLKAFYDYGYLSVQVFWCVSGYIFFWKYAQPISQRKISFKRFAWLRFSRLYPLHLVTLLLVAPMSWWYEARMGAGFVYQHQDWQHFILQLLMASDWGSGIEWSYNGPIWSISLEILVYMVFFGLCRLGITQVWAVLGLIAASGAVYASQATRHPIVLCLFFFYLGAFTCQVHAWLQEQVASRQTTLVALGVAACALVAWLTVAGFIRPMYCVAVLGPVALLALVRWVRPSTAKHTAALTQLGHMTYSSYLWHFPLQLAAALWFMHQPSALPAHSGWWLAGYLALTYAIALPSYHCIEAPVQRWLRRFTPAC